MNPKPLVLKFGLFLLLMIPLMIGACTNEVQIRKSALKYFDEGNSALKHRDYQAAIWNYQKAISLDSETPNFHYNLGLTYYEIANYKESIDSFKLSVAKHSLLVEHTLHVIILYLLTTYIK